MSSEEHSETFHYEVVDFVRLRISSVSQMHCSGVWITGCLTAGGLSELGRVGPLTGESHCCKNRHDTRTYCNTIVLDSPSTTSSSQSAIHTKCSYFGDPNPNTLFLGSSVFCTPQSGPVSS